MSSNTKHLIIAGSAVVVVIVLAIIFSNVKKPASVVTPATSAATATTPTVAATTDSTASSPSLSSSGWQAMLDQYSGRVVIFDAACQATPYSQVQGLGTQVLLANNSDVSHTVIAGAGSGYTIGAYHYKVITIATSDVMNISCDSNQKAAIITVK